MSESCRPRLIICTTCRAGHALEEGVPTLGARLYAALERLIAGAATPIDLQAAACLANCDRGCSGAIAMRGKWTYLLGLLSPEHAADLLAYSVAYAASASGTVLPSRRPASLQRMVMGRVPPLESVR